MDAWAVHLKKTNPGNSPASASLSLKRTWIPQRPNSCKIFQNRVSKICLSSSAHPSLSVISMAKNNDHDNSSSPSSSSGNDDHSVPDRDSSRINDSSEDNKSDDYASQMSLDVNTNWREFRSILYHKYQVEKRNSDAHKQGGIPHVSKPLSKKWAHPLTVPENGCVLLATEKLDGVRTFERTVVLLLRCGTRNPQEGPFGVVINRPLHKKIKHMKPANHELATTFGDCSLHFGGPLEASVFVSRMGQNLKLPGMEEVIPGLCFGARNSLDEAAELVKRGTLKSQDFKFFVGYAGWQQDQLREEIESDYWHVASCSSNLILGDSWSVSLWEEILQEMGGDYSELSRKPKRDI